MLVLRIAAQLLQVGEAELHSGIPERPGIRRRQELSEAQLDLVVELREAEALAVDEIIELILEIRPLEGGDDRLFKARLREGLKRPLLVRVHSEEAFVDVGEAGLLALNVPELLCPLELCRE